MSEKGVIAVDRGVFDHDCFADEPFTEREAWMWLIAEAAWKARTRRIGKVVVDLKRGQLAASLRFMGDRWGWSKDKVDRYFRKLKNRDMIATQTETGISVITICNYNTYQRVSLPDATDNETQTATVPRQLRDKREDIKHIEEDSEANASGADAPIDPSAAERELFRRGREVLGKQAGGLIAKLLKAKGGNVALARAAIETSATKENPGEYVGAACRGPPAGQPASVRDQRRQDWNDARQKLREHAYGPEEGDAEGGSTVRFLPTVVRQ